MTSQGKYSKRITKKIDPSTLVEIDGDNLRRHEKFYLRWMYAGRLTYIVGPLMVVSLYNDYNGKHIVAVDEYGIEQVIQLATDRLGDYPIFYCSK